VIVSDEPTTLQTFAQYRLRFQVEESFLDLKSNGFNLEASRLRDKFALTQLCGVIALTMLFLFCKALRVWHQVNVVLWTATGIVHELPQGCDLDMIYYKEIGKPYWLSLFQNWLQRVGVKTKVLKLSTTAAPVSFHLIPEQHKRCLMTVLQAASVTPDPIG
jgi:hypothetical protein